MEKKKEKKKKEVSVSSAQEPKTKGKLPRHSPAARSGDAIRVSTKDGESCRYLESYKGEGKPPKCRSGGPLASRIGDWCVLEVITLSDHQCIEVSIQERSHPVNTERGGKVRSPSWNTKRLSKDKLHEHLEENRLIDELGWASSARSMEDTVRATRRKVVTACDHSMTRRGHRRTGDSM